MTPPILLLGGSGRDLMVGGHGADRLVGNADDDILIAGYSAFEYDYGYAVDYRASDGLLRDEHVLRRSHEEAIGSIMREWNRNDLAYQSRRELITDPLQSSYVLKTGETDATVWDDGAEDMLTGAEGTDLFFANLFEGAIDKLTDLKAAEFAADLEFLGDGT